MKCAVHWLLILCVLLGLGLRAFAADPCEALIQEHAKQHAQHDHDPFQPCDPSHEEHCPLDHHQGVCTHSMPLADLSQSRTAAGHLAFSLSLMAADVFFAPEEPVAEMDKPPRI